MHHREDHETAASAVRNLNETMVGGRPLRIDLADSDPFLEGKTTVRGELLDSGYPGPSEPRSQWRTARNNTNDPDAFLSNVPSGIQVPKDASALDSISQTLAAMPPNQLMEVLAQMKAFVITHPDQARTLLVKHPQLSYALFQALLLNKIVDSVILDRMLASSRGSAAAASQGPPQSARPPMPAPPAHLQGYPPPGPSGHYQHHMPPFPPQPPMSGATPPVSAMFSHQQHAPPGQAPMQQQYYRPPPPPAPAQPPKPAAPEISDSQRAMIMQVLSLTTEQINNLAEPERNAILQLRNQFLGTFGNS